MYKSCNVVMLPTNKKAWIQGVPIIDYIIAKRVQNPLYEKTKDYLLNKLRLFKGLDYMCKGDYEFQHVYITSDEEIKKNDWCYNSKRKSIELGKYMIGTNEFIFCKKIIPTTDASLYFKCDCCNGTGIIEYKPCRTCIGGKLGSLPQPPQQFIQKYIEEYNKGNVITKVMVEYNYELSNDEDEQGNLIPDIYLKINSDNTINIKLIKDSWNNIDLVEFFKKLVVRGCFRGTESKSGRNYNIALQTFSEEFGLDYESEVDNL